MTTEQKNYLLVARFYIEHKNDPEGLELWLKRRRQNPMKGFFAEQQDQYAFSSSFFFYESKEGYSFWDGIRDEYFAWYDSIKDERENSSGIASTCVINASDIEKPLPERHADQIRGIIKDMLEQPVNARKPIPIFQKEPDNNGGIVSACIVPAPEENPLPDEFAEWLASVEAKNPEHAKFFRENFDWEEWNHFHLAQNPGIRAVKQDSLRDFFSLRDWGALVIMVSEKYPYPIKPREIPFTPDEATQGRFLVYDTGNKRKILFTNGKIWVFETFWGSASANHTWAQILKEFSAIAE